jgi:ribosome-associated translation inhibitor RaiA
MIYQLSSTNIELSPSMQELARQKFSKIEHYFSHVPQDLQKVRIVMNTGQAVDTFEVIIDLDLGTQKYYGKGINYGLETALLDAVEDVKEQYLKDKAKSEGKDWEEARDAKRFDPDQAEADLSEPLPEEA